VFSEWKDQAAIVMGVGRAEFHCGTTIPLNVNRFKILKLYFQKSKVRVYRIESLSSRFYHRKVSPIVLLPPCGDTESGASLHERNADV